MKAFVRSELHRTPSSRCVIRSVIFFCLILIIDVLSQSTDTQGAPPQHHRFKNMKIPRQVTYAYKENVSIIENDAFYTIPKDGSKTIDLLFVMANAPVKTASLPSAGAESYVGTTLAMKLVMEELSTNFSSFFPQQEQKTGPQSR